MKKNIYTIRCYGCGKIMLQYSGTFGIIKTKYSVCDECKKQFPELEKEKFKKKLEKYNKKIENDRIDELFEIDKDKEKEKIKKDR